MNIDRSPGGGASAQASLATAELHPMEVIGAEEWLTFKLGTEEYGIDILSVQEIRSYEQPTRVVHVLPAVKGVINLRGHIVPVVDLRTAFNLEDVHYDEFTVVIVVNVGKEVVGLVVDAVSDVTRFTSDQVKPSPGLTQSTSVDCVKFIGSVADRTLLLLDIQQLVNSPEMGLTPTPLQ